ncbi:bleomycin resistance protein, partial [Klebsiella pneumoniae]|nr:bleomycin resistance protein [Klebsiella pneumoniae]
NRICMVMGICALSSTVLAGQTPAPTPTASLTLVAESPENLWNSFVVMSNGRMFAGMPRWPGFEKTPSLVEIKTDGSLIPYPGGKWNNWQPDKSGAEAFININAINTFDGNTLWVVDQGAPPGSSVALPGAQKIVEIDTKTNKIKRIIQLGKNVLPPGAAINDIRIKGEWAYLTESGLGSIIVVNLSNGNIMRRLSNNLSTKQTRLKIGRDFEPLNYADGKPQLTNADPIELSPDGQWLYYAAASGPLYRVPTKALQDGQLSESDLSKQVQFVYDTPTLGGTAMDSKGNIYLAQADMPRIDILSPDGTLQVLAEDPRLLGGDAMFITRDGYLNVPIAQVPNLKFVRGPNGKDLITRPFKIWKFKLPENSGTPLHP